MRQCPNCRTQYTDDTLQFCLQDGTPLVPVFTPDADADEAGETATIVSAWKTQNRPADPTNVGHRPIVEPRPPSGKKRIWPVVIATMLGTILLLGLGAAGFWLYMNRRPGAAVRNTSSTANRSVETNSNSQAAPSPTATSTPGNRSPTPQPSPSINITQVERDIHSAVDNWISDTERIDLDSLLEKYADRVDYYRAGTIGRDRVRRDKERAFAAFDSIEMDVSDMKIEVADTGETATAEFDKEWVFEGDRTSTGKVRSQLTFRNVGGSWLITGERDLRVY